MNGLNTIRIQNSIIALVSSILSFLPMFVSRLTMIGDEIYVNTLKRVGDFLSLQRKWQLHLS